MFAAGTESLCLCWQTERFISESVDGSGKQSLLQSQLRQQLIEFRLTTSRLFPHFKQQRIHFAACGTSHILFLSQAGTVYQSEVKSKDTAAATKEFSIMKPQVLKSLSEKNIIQMACGNNHSLALSKDGQLFAWGQNTYGQLGIDTKGASQPIPRCVTSLTGMPVAQITAGGGHSFALSLSGAVFGWGRNDRGQLGLKDTEGLTTKPAVRRILAGGNQSFAQIGDEAGLESSVDPSALHTLKRIMEVDRVLEKELDRNTIRAIVQAFSSSQSLSASFLDVRFTGEASYGPGVSQEFFTLFGRELHSNGRIFQRSEDSELLWFPSWEPERDDVFYHVGILCGLAVSNGFICNFNFPLALYKKLLQVQPTLEDLKELSPVEGNSLQEVLDYEYDDTEDEFCLDFTIPRQTADGDTIYQDLIPNGSEIPVQKHNRKQYVDAYVDYKLNTSVKKQFEAFARGFRNSALPVVDVFRPEELRDLIHGNADYEWDLLEKNAGYDGYTQTDKAVRNFWEVFRNLEEEKKKRFLAFLSGSDRLPVGGIQNFQIAIINTRSSEPDSSYPRAYTCSRSLDLPNYSNIEILREKLLHAIESGEEFNAQEL
ncbi:hypothetical protein scyTo_0006395 [Scyliorhinus torazame]|uniref:HECT domain-containing protein n=1 Tax=Scyliorhinus torazame TaxID=75743 RepID=A0A401PHM2_SCYTO|nr:hypothetical protein [Scyliorhinus torazame]